MISVWGAMTLMATASAVTWLATPLVRRLALSFGAVDRAGGRHIHRNSVPTWGGIALGIGFFATLSVAGILGVDLGNELTRFGWPMASLVVGSLIVLVTGLVDDLLGMPALTKLALQLMAACVAVGGGFQFSAFSNPFFGGYIDLSYVGPAMSLLWIIGITNSFNLIDGLDGLASGVGLIAALTLLAVSAAGDRPDAVLMFAALAGSLLGFLRYNFHPASIFLGDSGSLLLGFLLAVMSLQSLQKGPTTVVMMVPLLTFGFPIIETTVTVARRYLVAGAAAIFHADADHIHHRLLASGFTHRRAVVLLYAACSLLGLLAYLAVAARGTLDAAILAIVIFGTIAAVRFIVRHPGAVKVVEPSLGTDSMSSAEVIRPRLCIVVLGDLGRSPRATYHAWAAAESGFEVDLVGQTATPMLPRISGHAFIRVHPLTVPDRIAWGEGYRIGALFHAVVRVLGQAIELLRTLHGLPHLGTILIQTPPAIPTLAVALLAARQRQAEVVIDWHNFGYSMLAERLGADHLLVRLAMAYEGRVGGRAVSHLCVSQAMRKVLGEQWGIPDAAVLYDRPAEHFRPLSEAQKAAARERIAARYRWPSLATPGAVLAVSPSSFTADEDLGVLFEALGRYGELGREFESRPTAVSLPLLLVALSGAGDLREAARKRAGELCAHKVEVQVIWVEADDYPQLIGAADLGICLHRSTSGVDLPMKVADMLGAGIPVCALAYGPCLGEQLEDGTTGLLFDDAEGLARGLVALLTDGREGARLRSMAEAVRAQPRVSFADEWRRVVMPLLLSRNGVALP